MHQKHGWRYSGNSNDDSLAWRGLPGEPRIVSGVENAYSVCKNSELVLVRKFGAPIVQKLERLNPNRTEFPDRNADSFWSEKRAELDCGNRRAGCKETQSREQVQDVDSMTPRA